MHIISEASAFGKVIYIQILVKIIFILLLRCFKPFPPKFQRFRYTAIQDFESYNHRDFKCQLNTCHIVPLWQISAETLQVFLLDGLKRFMTTWSSGQFSKSKGLSVSVCFPSPPPLSSFWILHRFRVAKRRKSHSSDFPCSTTPRKRLLCRLGSYMSHQSQH